LSQSIWNGSWLAVLLGLYTNNFFLAESMKEGSGSVNNFLDNNNDNDDDDANVNVVEVVDEGEQSPNNSLNI
jgi:hypothetical protein